MPEMDAAAAASASGSSNEIALCLSGGGYRAAAFHLGTLDVLERLGLTHKVKVLATISGGSITGVLWALALARGRSFDAFFRGLYRSLLQVNVVKEAFARLHGTATGRRRPSLARAAAEVYASDAFAGEAKLRELKAAAPVPDDVLFCSTELDEGLAFRFQASRALALLAAAQAYAIWSDWQGDWRTSDAIALVTCLAIAGLLLFGRSVLVKVVDRVKDLTGVGVWDGLEKITLGQLIELLDRRARTVMSITTTVFLKRIRSLQQELCFENAKLRDRVIFGLIYSLLTPVARLQKAQPWLTPSPALIERATLAEKTGTTLWIGEKELRATIVAGQATTLYKLFELYYLGQLPAVQAVLGPSFLTDAQALWQQLQQNPESLLR